MNLNIGLDLGSTAIKTIFVDGDEIIWHCHTPTAPGQEALAWKMIDRGLSFLGARREDIKGLASTGYGKKLFSLADKNLDEITANAAGIFKLSGGQAKTIVNIGGQDLKVINLDTNGQVEDFKMNDKCAAGTGRFFEAVSRILDTPLEEFEKLSMSSQNELEINSTCVVFAESEIVSLLARGASKNDLIKALNVSVARRVAAMMGNDFCNGLIYLDGGPAHNLALLEALEDELLSEVRVLDKPQFTVAYGAALSLAD